MKETKHTKKQTKGALTREKIVQTARNLFYRKGYDATSTATIAKEVGVSEAALYKYFKGKMKLLLATVKPERLDFKEENEYLLLSDQELLHVWVEELVDTVFYNRLQYSILFIESPKHPELSEQYIANIHSMSFADKELMKRMDEGKLPKLDLILFQVGIIGSLLAMVTHKRIYDHTLCLDQIPTDIRQTLIGIVEGKLFN
ncbi:TetR/AcrR family transcriptional regulator [Rummeliibacillus pycnus]|uniref:TetR/AcrR family transcriptional regulator n=1 Tax=Rummeliibacillus pycnus TaxID=101070 RepID=UPI000C9C61BB|nr:TetR/AcrR family transcriptional regulator [Rummeliibacillus pycnus]